MSPINPIDVPWERNEKVLVPFPFGFLAVGLIMGLLVSSEAIEFKDSKYIFEIPSLKVFLDVIITIFAYWLIMLIPGLLVYY